MITYREIASNFKTKTNIGLGNHMFMLASTVGIAVKHGYGYGFEPFYPEVFVNQSPEDSAPKGVYSVPWGYHNVKVKDNTILRGYMQSEKYFAHCADLVRWHFQMVPFDVTVPDDAVAIHVRGGDYVNSSHHFTLWRDYYERAMDVMKGTYLIFTDDPVHCEKIFPGYKVSNGEIYAGWNIIHGDIFRDFYMMRQCKKFIIANSSLSWWAAWLSQGETIAPRNWFAGSNLKLDTTDLYCKDWRLI